MATKKADKPQRLEFGTHEDAVEERLRQIEETKAEAAESERRVALRIKEFRGRPVVNRFFPWGGVAVKAHEVFYANNAAEAREFIRTGIVELADLPVDEDEDVAE